MSTLYRRLADHYLEAIQAGTLKVGDRFPSVRQLMRTHEVSLSTALQVCRRLEDQGWLEARPRSGYFVQRVRRAQLPPASECPGPAAIDPADYVGIHAHVSEILLRGQQQPVRVNLAIAVCTPSVYPSTALNRIMQRSLREHPNVLTTMTRRYGHPALRAVLARRMLARGVAAAPEDVVITQGCTEAIQLALRAVTRPGDTVAVESPTFYGVLQVLETLGLRALEIPTSPATGLSIEALAFALEQGTVGTHSDDTAVDGSAYGIKAVLCMPTLHNPLGCVMPDAHKQRLVQLCEQHDIALIEDDIYSDMGNDDVPWKPAKAWDRSGQVIHCASLNKVLAPGLRLGWMLAGRWQARIEMLKFAQTRYPEELTQIVAAEFLDGSGFDRHVRQLQRTLRDHREQMAEGVATHFPAGTRLSLPDGGLLLWVQMPEQVSSDQVFDAALQQGIKLAPGSMFSNSARFNHCIRLSCGGTDRAATQQALREVGAIVERLAAAPDAPVSVPGRRVGSRSSVARPGSPMACAHGSG